MKRLTVHLSGVKPILVTTKKYNKSTNKYDYSKKKKTINTITFTCNSEDEGLTYMSTYIENREKKDKGVKITKHYFSNIY